MPEIKILTVGKTKDKTLSDAIKDYTRRLRGRVVLHIENVRDDGQLLEAVKRHRRVIALDEKGLRLSSQDFSEYLFTSLESHGARLTFLIGGAEGLPQALPPQLPRVSPSPLTFTHQMVRLVLVEQIYRAFEIRKGTAYHK